MSYIEEETLLDLFGLNCKPKKVNDEGIQEITLGLEMKDDVIENYFYTTNPIILALYCTELENKIADVILKKQTALQIIKDFYLDCKDSIMYEIVDFYLVTSLDVNIDDYIETYDTNDLEQFAYWVSHNNKLWDLESSIETNQIILYQDEDDRYHFLKCKENYTG